MGRYLESTGRAARYRRFLLARLPILILARLGIVEAQAVKERWVLDLAGLLEAMSERELERMGEWVAERVLWPQRRETVVAELEAHRRAGRRVALVSGVYQPVLEALARRLGFEAYGTRLEIDDGVSTGRVAAVNAGPAKTAILRAILRDDELVAAYGDTHADVVMLELAREPVAVCPDAALRRVAIERGWRILEH